MAWTVELQHLRRGFWREVRNGLPTVAAARVAGVSEAVGFRWFRQCGGVAPVSLAEPIGRYLNLAEREEIAVGQAAGLSIREIARRLGREASTVSRELRRDGGTNAAGQYRAVPAQAAAEARARRPKRRRLENPQLNAHVQQLLEDKWSPEEIAGRLPVDFPDDESMRASHETIYRSLFIQGKGALRKELTACLRTGRALRRPRKRVDGRADPDRRIPDKVMLSERPAEADDRAVPGHWEGDLILGANNRSAVGTLVERSTRFVVL